MPNSSPLLPSRERGDRAQSPLEEESNNTVGLEVTDDFTVQLTSGHTIQGQLKGNGSRAAKFRDLPAGSGTATATFAYGTRVQRGYGCP